MRAVLDFRNCVPWCRFTVDRAFHGFLEQGTDRSTESSTVAYRSSKAALGSTQSFFCFSSHGSSCCSLVSRDLHRWSTGRLGLRMQKRREEKTHQKLLYLVSLHGLEDPKITLTSSIAHFSQVARKIFWLKSAANTYPLHATHVLSTSEEILKKFDP